jgi:hypothetical protein
MIKEDHELKSPVKLQAIIEGMEMQFEESQTFLNIKTGEIISVSSDDLRAAEDDEPLDDLFDWQQEARNVAIDVLENFENYKELPTQYEINEYQIMEDFCFTVHDERKQDLLLRSIKGKGAFRRFKDKIMDFGLVDKWYAYRDERLKQIAIEWCQYNNIDFIE